MISYISPDHRLKSLKIKINPSTPVLHGSSPYLPIGDGANKPANAPTAAEPNAIKPSGIVAAVLMLK
jgi:hypothetical protein